MLRATEILSAGSWRGSPADVVRLDYDKRTRRRMVHMGAGGLAFLLDLPMAPNLREGDGIRLEDGSLVAVEAAPEALLEIRCADAHKLARVAWHLGNRHLATEIGEGVIHIRDDHVIAEMVRGLGAEVRQVQRPFNPEGGAYGHAAAHGHSHGHHHSHHGHHDDEHHH
jgi:urease accessory protein